MIVFLIKGRSMSWEDGTEVERLDMRLISCLWETLKHCQVLSLESHGHLWSGPGTLVFPNQKLILVPSL